VIDNPLLDSELPESIPLEEHVAEVKKMMDTAERELYRAKEKYRATTRSERMHGDEMNTIWWAKRCSFTIALLVMSRILPN